MNGRQWTHDEMGDGKPTAAAYRNGCRCYDCREKYREYQKAYATRRVHEMNQPDGTGVYHSHRGQPSKKTAQKHKCRHQVCLDKAGLRVDQNGFVVSIATGEIQPLFGQAEVTVP